ncbi:EAL domain-containing protein [Vibrio hepatarius]|uniref:EAL domain-containing protein n=1 Tax=Vibrio hepatarius TaxID=171383 RepID=UPI00142D26D3|nr:EAL domain-containing protein [Vibrio hepatarius]NIY85347.1 EAL domain-containing protein [Vibrio hepatarius]
MSQSLSSIAFTPKVTEQADYAISVDEEQELQPLTLTEAELDELMDKNVRHIADVLNDGLFYMSDTGHVRFYSSTFYEQFGNLTGCSTLQTWLERVHPLDRDLLQSKVDEYIRHEGRKLCTQYRVRNEEGNYIWIQGTAVTKIINGKRVIIGCHKGVYNTKRKQAFAQHSRFVESGDTLANEHKLELDIENASLGPAKHSLIYIQIANIRSYLSLYGTGIISDVLNHLKHALNYFPLHSLDLYSIRSDDFAILISGDYTQDELLELGQRISQRYYDSVKANDFLYGTEISLGIYPNFPKHKGTDEAIKVASRTSQFASQQDSHQVSIYNGKTKAKVDRYFFIERELGNTIKQETLSVKYQPIVCAKRNKVASFEALVRWKSKEFGDIFPDEFISVAEKKGLIVDLGYLVFSKACEFLHKYNTTHENPVRINVNVSVIQLLNHSFPDTVKTIADQYQVSPHNIVLELTETLILDGNRNAVIQLNRLKEYGFQLSLDDFGSGYSSLNSFFDLPLQQIKVDRSIAQRSMTNPATFEYLSFVTQLCRTYDVDIVIEGIEDAKMQRMFTEMGASYLQGYWFSKPLSLASASHYTLI